MIISNDKIKKMEKAEKVANKIAQALLLCFFVSIIVAFAHEETNTACFYASIAVAVFAAMVIIAGCVVEPRCLLRFVGLKRGQKLYAISYWDLSIVEAKAVEIDLNNIDRLVSITKFPTNPLHRDIYLTKREAEGALSWFLECLYRDVKNYVGFEGILSESAKEELREGFMRYMRKEDFWVFTEYELPELVRVIMQYHDYLEANKRELNDAKEALKESFKFH